VRQGEEFSSLKRFLEVVRLKIPGKNSGKRGKAQK
jgi:hypothetical protein